MSVRADDPSSIAITWGVNRWVMIECRGKTLQVQAAKHSDLARAVTAEFGIPEDPARAWARAQWKTRPKDAGAGTARAGESAHSATGLPTWVLVAILVGLVAAWVIWARLSGDLIPT